VQLNGTLRRVAKFKHMGMMPPNQNCIHKEIKSILNSDNAHYHSIQNLLLSCPLSKNIQIKICKTIILHAGFMDVKLHFSHQGKNKDHGCLRRWCAEETTWTHEGGSNRKMENAT
jgi:hypothetical protein